MRRAQVGFTLVELIMVIVVVGAIFAIGGLVMGRAFDSYSLARDSTDTDWQGRVAFERMVRELREVRSASATDLSFPEGAQIRFIDADGVSGCFIVSGGSLQRGDDGPAAASCTTNLRRLADNVVSLTFDYYDNAGANPAAVTAVYYVTIALQVSRGSISETYRGAAKLRRL